MQKRLIVLIVLLALIIAALPVAALAGKAQEFEVTVRNRTDHPAEVKVIGTDGVPHMFTVPAGISYITLPEGVHNYWVGSACGHTAGTWNMNVDKTLWIDCTTLGNAAWLTRTATIKGEPACADTGFFLLAGDAVAYFTETYWHFESIFSYPDTYLFMEKVYGADNLTYGCITDHPYNVYLDNFSGF